MADKNFKVKHGLAMGEGIIRFDAETSTWQLSTDGVTFSQVASASTTLDGLSDVSVSAALAGDFLKWNGTAWVPSTVALGTNTTGNYVADVVSGTGVTVSHTPGEGSSASISIGQSVATTASVTFAHVSAPLTGNVTGDVTGNAGTATSLQTARAINLAGDLSGSASFNGTADVTITATVQPNSVALGTDTTGNFVADVVAGTGVTVTHTPGEGSSASIAIGQSVATNANPFFAGATLDAVQIGITAANEIDTTTGNLTIDSAGGTVTIDDNLIVSGDLTVNGTTTTVNTETINLADNVIVLNSNETSSPSQNAGIEVERGTATNVALRWNETTDKWELTTDGTNYADIATEAYAASLTPNSLDEIGDVNIVSASAGDFLKWNGSAWVNDPINLGSDTVGNYVSDVSGGTGVTVTHTPGEGSTPSIAIGQAVGTSSSVTFAAVTAPLIGNASTATTLETSRTIELTGDVTGSASFNGSANASITATIAPNSVALGTDTTGNYVSDVTGGTGVTVTHTPGEGSSPSIAIGQAVGTSSSVTFAAVTAPLIGNASTATTLQNARTINLGGDLSGSASFNGSADVTITATVQPNSVALGTDTTGNYMSDLTAGTGISITHTPGEGSNATITNSGVTSVNGGTGAVTNIATTTGNLGQFAATTSSQLAGVISDETGSGALVFATSPTLTTPNLGTPSALTLTNATGLPVSGITSSTTAALGVGGIELGHATDTTLARGAAGRLTVEGVDVPTISSTDTLTNKTLSSATLTGSLTAGGGTGTAGQFLKSTGTGVEWAAAGGGGQVTTTTISTNSETTIATFTSTSAKAAEFHVRVGQGDRLYSTKVLALHNGTTADFTRYGELSFTGNEVMDAVYWVTRTSNFGNTQVRSVRFGNGIWLATGYAGQIRTSTDAVTWVTQTSNFGSTNIWSAAFGNNIWVAVGSGGGALRSSTDAITWVTQTSNFSFGIFAVDFGNNLFAAGGQIAELRTSTDAITWVTRTSNFGNSTIYSLKFGNNLWLAGGDSGTLRSSTDAITWTTRVSNMTGRINAFAFGNNIWTAVGDSGQLRTSTDAITWVTRTPNIDNFSNINTVANNNNIWIVGGSSGTRTSTDAITWVTTFASVAPSIWSFAYANNIWVGGGSGGSIGTSATTIEPIHVGGLSSSASVALNTDISGSDVRLRMTIQDANIKSATVKVVTTTVGEL